MKYLALNNLKLSSSDPKICVPVMGKDKKEVLEQVKIVKRKNPDLIEFRADFLKWDKDLKKNLKNIKDILEAINKECDIPLIFTIRTAKEGGELDIEFAQYALVNIEVAKISDEYNVALIDVEGIKHKCNTKLLIEKIHEAGGNVIVSNHNFHKTLAYEFLIRRIQMLSLLDADVVKIAMMPRNKRDVDNLMMAVRYADKRIGQPIVAMSMGEMGSVTRAATKKMGTVFSFASGVDESAPGQPRVEVLRYLLKDYKLNKNIALIGFMGTGKTTISYALHNITGFDEIDSDAYIVEKAKKSISDIFKDDGEAKFRELETLSLKEIGDNFRGIISCGGGAVLKQENVDILKKSGVIIQLYADAETIFERVRYSKTRPILNEDMSVEHISRLMSARDEAYTKAADIRTSVADNNRLEACYRILTQLEKLGVISEIDK